MELRGRTIHVWRLALDEEDPATLAACAGMLSGDELVRADRFKSPAARSRFVQCRAALRALVHTYAGGESPAAVVFDRGPFGKPVLAGPRPERLYFNVSHTSGIAMIALASRGPVGVDVERIHELPDRDRLAARCLSAGEWARLSALPAAARNAGFFQGWTRKEAFIKATGEGLSRPLQDVEVSLGPGEPARFLRVPGPPGAERGWSLHAFEPAAGYTAAVAAPWPGSTLMLLNFHRDVAGIGSTECRGDLSAHCFHLVEGRSAGAHRRASRPSPGSD